MEVEEDLIQSYDDNVPTALRGRYMAKEVWSRDDLGFDLTVEEQLFVRSYIIDRNEIAALKRLGYDDSSREKLKRIANRFLNSSTVQEAIEAYAKRIMDKLEITAERVNDRMASIAFTDVTDVAIFEGGNLVMLPSVMWPEHAKNAIKSVKYGQFGLNLEFYDKQKALDFLAKQTGLDQSEKNASIAAAEATAALALGKMVEVVERMRSQREAKEPEGVLIEHRRNE